jgi:uncharacterized protein (DUF1800 family)
VTSPISHDETSSATLTRRTILGAAAGGAAVVASGWGAGPAVADTAVGAYGTVSRTAAPLNRRPPALATTPLKPKQLAGSNAVDHLLRRATYGLTPELTKEARSVGAATWLEAQLNPAHIVDTVCNSVMKRFPLLNLTAAQARTAFPKSSWDIMESLTAATVARAVWSQRQLFEVMVDFWGNHLNVTCPSSDVWDSRHLYDRDVIRKYALGKFSDMLWASATHPAMLHYLNNASSSKDDPNENYGRELLELHTVGVDAGYSEAEMRASGLVMTGFSVRYSWETGYSAPIGAFQFKQAHNYLEDAASQPLAIAGWTSPKPPVPDGYAVAKSYLAYLAGHRFTAYRIARKLAIRFVSDNPSEGLVRKLADVYLSNDTAVIPVLRALFASREFTTSMGAKIRRPYEDVIASVRALGMQPDAIDPVNNPEGIKGIQSLRWMCETLGHSPMAWPLPNGYPDVVTSWQSAAGTLSRWNSHADLSGHWWPKELTVPATYPRSLLPATLPATYGELVSGLAQTLIGTPIRAEHITAVLTFFGVTASDQPKETHAAITWRLPNLITLLLDSPYHGVR